MSLGHLLYGPDNCTKLRMVMAQFCSELNATVQCGADEVPTRPYGRGERIVNGHVRSYTSPRDRPIHNSPDRIILYTAE